MSGFDKANKQKPLMKGFRDKTVAEPLNSVSEKVDAVIEDLKQLEPFIKVMVQKIEALTKENNSLSLFCAALQRHLESKFGDEFKNSMQNEKDKLQLERRDLNENAFNVKMGYSDITDNTRAYGATGDIAVINLKALSDMPEFKDFNLAYFPFVSDFDSEIKDLNKNLEGMLIGDKKTFTYTFDDTCAESSWRGKTVEFLVELVKIKVKKSTDATS